MKQNYLSKKQIRKIKKKARKYADLFDEITKVLNEDKEMDIRELSNLIDELKDLKGEDLYKNNIKEIDNLILTTELGINIVKQLRDECKEKVIDILNDLDKDKIIKEVSVYGYESDKSFNFRLNSYFIIGVNKSGIDSVTEDHRFWVMSGRKNDLDIPIKTITFIRDNFEILSDRLKKIIV
ncbi:hypothetical protein Q5M87_11430 [Brachyspira innocens]|uniref:hypothetical protein n=1 Tax=Brachyspira innocens TaxID=13264 RepID=UPI0026EDA433|nr:hypothetical protein [Brachyspira innocens]MDO6994617.1 hypothetical protein [Brachyspira innocens]